MFNFLLILGGYYYFWVKIPSFVPVQKHTNHDSFLDSAKV